MIIIAEHQDLQWNYDKQADVLYLSVAEPQPAIGIDIGDGFIVRYDEKKGEVIGFTVIGLKTKVTQNLN